MPIHDWTRVNAGIFHDFHHEWISTIRRQLNSGLLPPDYYALADQQAGGFGPDVLTLQSMKPAKRRGMPPAQPTNGSSTAVLAPPKTRFTAETAEDFSRRKVSTICVRHVSGDRVVAVVEVISPSNKSSRRHFKDLISKILELLQHNIHLLILDVFPPTKRDPSGLHAAVWDEIGDEPFTPPADKPLTAVSYEAGLTTKAYIEPLAVGDRLPDMPLFLEPGTHVPVPLEATYEEAFAAVPARWREELE